MPGVCTVAAQVEIDRGAEADGFAFGEAEFFMQQLHELLHQVVVGEVGGEVHCGECIRCWSGKRSSMWSIQRVTNAMLENSFKTTVVAGHRSDIRGYPYSVFYQPPIYCKAGINDDLFE
ncbi:hypothetical protein D9M73_227050 [compost metagenome]